MKKMTTVRENGQLFGKIDILECFFEQPEKEYHIREIARIINLRGNKNE